MFGYSFQTLDIVEATVYGKIIETKHTNILFDHPVLGLDAVYWLERKQKGHYDRLPDVAIERRQCDETDQQDRLFRAARSSSKHS